VTSQSRAALTETSLGRWKPRPVWPAPHRPALGHLPPLAVVHAFLRHYPAADSAADRAIAPASTNPMIVSVKVAR
jgi:hypothetical protein